MSWGSLKWVPSGQAFQIAGRCIVGGNYYLGSGILGAGGHGIEPALIDPSLKVNWRSPDWAGSGMHYWPSYEGISPECRAAFLSWLGSDRANPSTYIGYVFLYFYGLERRALLDLALDLRYAETVEIANELRRLIATYGTNRSFKSYASGLLEVIESSSYVSASLSPPDPSSLEPTYEVPIVIKVALGRYVACGQPIPADWALALLRTLPDAFLKTPATRCRSEFDALFRLRYRQTYNDGMVIRPPKATIKLSYRPASSGFGGSYDASLGGLPDVTGLERVKNRLRDLGTGCTGALDAHSRFLGRNPNGRGSSQAAGLLPPELLATHGGQSVDWLRQWAVDLVASGEPATTTIDDVVARWSPGRAGKLTKADAVSLAGMLAKLGVGIEPDVRFGGATPTHGSSAVLFRLPDGATSAPSPQYAAAAVLVHLCAAVAAADGSVTDDERMRLAQHLENVLGLDAAERRRLEAHLEWLIVSKSSLAGLKKRIDHIDAAPRAAVGGLLVDIAAADGVVTPEEITTLTKLYRLLGLDEKDVYSAIHGLGTDDAGPVPVLTAGEAEQRWAIPAPGSQPTGVVTLDLAKVQARLADTAAVTALLAGVFSEDSDEAAGSGPFDQAPVSGAPGGTSDSQSLPGLDSTHSELARRLCSQPMWDRAEAEELAASLGLPMFDGALDYINECAFEACAEPLVDGDDPLEINEYAVKELL